MAVRIFQPARNAMQSGHAGARQWVLEYEPEMAKRIEPLMGWTGSSDMRHSELRLRFDSREAAVAFAEKHNLVYQIIEPRRRHRLIKTYADNFRAGRPVPWTH